MLLSIDGRPAGISLSRGEGGAHVPTIAANTERWTRHQWIRGGHEWSPGGSQAGTDLLWWRTLLPRLRTFVPARTILEIGPGYGRWTEYLTSLCEHLIAIDVTPACIESCRARFAGDPRLEFHVNDGTSLDVVRAHSVDLVFSFDSLVHAEGDVLDRYIEQLPRVLSPGGVAFLHHSNLGAFVDPGTNDVRRYVTRRHWRAATMSARRLRDACRRAGLHCEAQEMINWIGRGRTADRPKLDGRLLPLTDCLSIVKRRDRRHSDEATRVAVNPAFVEEWRDAVWLAAMYPPQHAESTSDVDAAPASVSRRLSTASSLLRRGPLAFARVARERARAAGHAARAWSVGQVLKRREPFATSLRAGKCPDCGTAVEKPGTCRQCAVRWVLVD